MDFSTNNHFLESAQVKSNTSFCSLQTPKSGETKIPSKPPNGCNTIIRKMKFNLNICEKGNQKDAIQKTDEKFGSKAFPLERCEKREFEDLFDVTSTTAVVCKSEADQNSKLIDQAHQHHVSCTCNFDIIEHENNLEIGYHSDRNDHETATICNYAETSNYENTLETGVYCNFEGNLDNVTEQEYQGETFSDDEICSSVENSDYCSSMEAENIISLHNIATETLAFPEYSNFSTNSQDNNFLCCDKAINNMVDNQDKCLQTETTSDKCINTLVPAENVDFSKDVDMEPNKCGSDKDNTTSNKEKGGRIEKAVLCDWKRKSDLYDQECSVSKYGRDLTTVTESLTKLKNPELERTGGGEHRKFYNLKSYTKYREQSYLPYCLKNLSFSDVNKINKKLLKKDYSNQKKFLPCNRNLLPKVSHIKNMVLTEKCAKLKDKGHYRNEVLPKLFRPSPRLNERSRSRSSASQKSKKSYTRFNKTRSLKHKSRSSKKENIRGSNLNKNKMNNFCNFSNKLLHSQVRLLDSCGSERIGDQNKSCFEDKHVSASVGHYINKNSRASSPKTKEIKNFYQDNSKKETISSSSSKTTHNSEKMQSVMSTLEHIAQEMEPLKKSLSEICGKVQALHIPEMYDYSRNSVAVTRSPYFQGFPVLMPPVYPSFTSKYTASPDLCLHDINHQLKLSKPCVCNKTKLLHSPFFLSSSSEDEDEEEYPDKEIWRCLARYQLKKSKSRGKKVKR